MSWLSHRMDKLDLSSKSQSPSPRSPPALDSTALATRPEPTPRPPLDDEHIHIACTSRKLSQTPPCDLLGYSSCATSTTSTTTVAATLASTSTSASTRCGDEAMGAHSKPASSPVPDQTQQHDVDIDAGADALGHKDALPGVLRSVEDDSWNPPLSTIEPDFSIDDEAYAASVATSYVSSLASDIRRGVEENGRLYAAYGIHKPWVPIDDREVSVPVMLSPLRHPTSSIV
jgi:hypothetical protein